MKRKRPLVGTLQINKNINKQYCFYVSTGDFKESYGLISLSFSKVSNNIDPCAAIVTKYLNDWWNLYSTIHKNEKLITSMFDTISLIKNRLKDIDEYLNYSFIIIIKFRCRLFIFKKGEILALSFVNNLLKNLLPINTLLEESGDKNNDLYLNYYDLSDGERVYIFCKTLYQYLNGKFLEEYNRKTVSEVCNILSKRLKKEDIENGILLCIDF